MRYLMPTEPKICKLCTTSLFKVAGTKVGHICGRCGEQYTLEKPPRIPKLPYNCKFCGAGSWIPPEDQEAPPDYGHESDHGTREDYLESIEEESE